MSSTYDFAEPGFVLIDRVNEMNNNWWCENIRATNPCGEQPLPPYGSCLLGSVNLTSFVRDPFTEHARFDWEEYREVVQVFTRMLDNVVEVNGLPLEQQRDEIMRKRRHGMGFLGLGSTITMLRMKYGSRDSVAFTERVSRELALAGWEAALELAEEKGPAPIMLEEFEVTPEMLRKRPEMRRDGIRAGQKLPGRILHARYSRYMQRVAEVAPELVDRPRGDRRALHAPQLDRADRHDFAVAGQQRLERHRALVRAPLFPQRDPRGPQDQGEHRRVLLRAARLSRAREPRAMPDGTTAADKLPDYFTTADDITPREHVDIQAAAQKWVDSSISKTANVPTDYRYDDFKDIYLYAHEQGLKGCTTFRFNPEAFQGVLVKEEDLKNTTYVFTLEDGTEVRSRATSRSSTTARCTPPPTCSTR